MKMFFLESEQVKLIDELFKNSIDNQYIVLSRNNGFSDIAQYSSKYMNVHFASVPTDKLNPYLDLFSR